MEIKVAKTIKEINAGLRIIKMEFLEKHGYTLKNTKTWFFDSKHILIIVKDFQSNVIGSLVFRNKDRFDIYISFIAVTQKKKGIAKLLLTYLESWVILNKKLSITIHADVRNYNYASILLFKSLNYKIIQGNLKYEDNTISLNVYKPIFILNI